MIIVGYNQTVLSHYISGTLSFHLLHGVVPEPFFKIQDQFQCRILIRCMLLILSQTLLLKNRNSLKTEIKRSNKLMFQKVIEKIFKIQHLRKKNIALFRLINY